MMKKMKRLGALLMALVMTFCLLPAAALVSAEDSKEGTLDVSKVVDWVKKPGGSIDYSQVDVTITSNVPPVERYAPANVLFLGTRCSAHEMAQGTLEKSLNAIAEKGNVTYYIFDSSSSNSASASYSGTLAYGKTISEGSFRLTSANHSSLSGFLNTVYTELVTQQKSYDYIVLEFDGDLLACDFNDEDVYGPFGIIKWSSAYSATKLTSVARALKPYYDNNQVIWVTPGNWKENTRKYEFPTVIGNYLGYENERDHDYLAPGQLHALAALTSPAYMLSHNSRYNETYYGSGTSGNVKTLPSLDAAYQVNYTNAKDLCDYLRQVIKGSVSLYFQDTIKLNKNMTVLPESLAFEYTTKEKPGAKDWEKYAKGTIVLEPKTNTIYAEAEDLDPSITFMRVKIRVSSVNNFKDVIEERKNPDGSIDLILNPNDGKAEVKAKIVYSDGSSTEEAVAEGTALAEQPLKLYMADVTVTGGSGSGKFYASEGDDLSVSYAPNQGYKLKSVTIDGVDSTKTAGTGYTFANVAKNHKVEVVYIPDIVISKAANPSQDIKAGDEFTYTITVNQTTGEELRTATVADEWPEGLTYVTNSAAPTAGVKVDQAKHTIIWSGQDLASGDNTFSFKVKVPENLTKSVTYTNKDYYVEWNKENYPGSDKPVDTPVDPQEFTLDYVYATVTNPIAAPSSVTKAYGSKINLAAPVCEGWIFRGWYDSADFARTAAPDHAAGSEYSLTADKTLYGGWELEKDFYFVKDAFVNGESVNGKSAKAGDEVTFKIKVKNNSVATVSNVIITDSVVGFQSIKDISNGGSLIGNTITWSLTLTSGQEVELSFKAAVPKTLAQDVTLSNSAHLSYDGVEKDSKTPATPAGTDSEPVEFTGKHDTTTFTIEKVWSDGWSEHAGDTITAQLYADGVVKGDPFTLTKDAPSVTRTVPDYDGEKAIVYSVKEKGTEGYLENGAAFNEYYNVSYSLSESTFTIYNDNTVGGKDILKNVAAPEKAVPGQSDLYYSVQLQNQATAVAGSVVASIQLPNGIVYNDTKANVSYDPSSNTLTWTAGDIAASGSASLNFYAKAADPIKTGTYPVTLKVTAVNGDAYNDLAPATDSTDVGRLTVKFVWPDAETHEAVSARLLKNGQIQLGSDKNMAASSWTAAWDTLDPDATYSAVVTDPEGYTVTSAVSEDSYGKVITFTAAKKTFAVNYVFVGDMPTDHADYLPEQEKDIPYNTAFTAADLKKSPIPTGFEVSKWYTKSDCQTTDLYVDGTPIRNDLTLFAKWSIDKVKIEYSKQGVPADVTNLPSQDVVQKGTKYTPVTPNAADHNRFDGWFTDDKLTNPYDPEKPLMESVVLYGKWTPLVDATITYSGDVPAGFSTSSQTIEKNTAPILPNVVAPVGYRFDGWFYEDGTPYSSGTAISKDTRIIGKWTKLFNVTYAFTGAVLPEDAESLLNALNGDSANKNIARGTAYTAKVLPTSADIYHLEGWYTDKECTEPYVNGSALAADLTLWGNWVRNKITVSFVYLGDVPELSDEPIEKADVQIFQQTTFSPGEAPSFEGYRFDGWYTDKECTQKFVPTVLNKDTTLYGKWFKQVQVSYEILGTAPNGRVAPKTATIDLGDDYIAIVKEDMAETGYEFHGWFTDEGCKTAFGEHAIVNENIKLFGYYETLMAVNYHASKTQPAEMTTPYPETEYLHSGDAYTALDASLYGVEGFAFDGWFTDEDCTVPYVDGTKISGNLDLYGKWRNVFDVAFSAAEGGPEGVTLPKNQKVADGDKIVYTAQDAKNLEAEGWTNLGWFTDEACTEPFDPAKDTITGDTILYTAWSRDTVSVSYEYVGSVPEGLEDPDTDTVNWNEAAEPLTPKEDGYSFEGWFFDKECKKPYKGEPLEEDTKLYGKWLKICDVEYAFVGKVPEGAKLPAKDSVKEGEKFTPAKPESVKGYKFSGWFLDKECTKEYKGEPLTGDVKLYGKWIEVSPVSPKTGVTMLVIAGSAACFVAAAAAYVSLALSRRKKNG